MTIRPVEDQKYRNAGHGFFFPFSDIHLWGLANLGVAGREGKGRLVDILDEQVQGWVVLGGNGWRFEFHRSPKVLAD